MFDAETAKAYLARLEFIYTPKHGSWLDRAEIELAILQRDCLNRHMATKELLIEQIRAWQMKRNTKQAKANWQFTTKDVRTKLHKLYPTVWPLSTTSRSEQTKLRLFLGIGLYKWRFQR